MGKQLLKNCVLDKEKLPFVMAMAVFGSYHEACFDKNRSDIDIAILLEKELDIDMEFDIEDYLDSILPGYFQHDRMHYTFISGFQYPFSELLLMSKDRIVFSADEEYLEYMLGYSAFKRDREALEIMREENLKELEAIKNGLLQV